jgi:hypothetical protein
VSQPRNQCRKFMADRKAIGTLIPKAEFDSLARSRSFSVGPYRDTFGDGPGDPYQPNRQVFGELKDGRCVYCELEAE